jgi:hypothetical protein
MITIRQLGAGLILSGSIVSLIGGVYNSRNIEKLAWRITEAPRNGFWLDGDKGAHGDESYEEIIARMKHSYEILSIGAAVSIIGLAITQLDP